MSALLGIRHSGAALIMTDAAFYDLRDGAIRAISSKQIITPNGILIAGGGLHLVATRFARLAAACANFDEAIRSAPELWAQATKDAPEWSKGMPCALIVAGWSEERQRVEVDGFNTPDGGATTQHFEDYTVIATGPNTEPLECVGEFVERFTDAAARDAFDPRRDGLALMEQLRRYPKKFEHGTQSAVGGFCQLSVVGRDGIGSMIIHHWRDLIGRPIDTGLDGKDEWRGPGGISEADFRTMREALVRKWWRSGGNAVEGLFGVERRLPSQNGVAFDVSSALTNAGVGAAVGGLAGGAQAAVPGGRGVQEARLGGTRTDASPAPPPPAGQQPPAAAPPTDALDRLVGNEGAPLLERVEQPPLQPAAPSVPDRALDEWMYRTLQHGESQQPAARPAAPAQPETAANLDMISLTEEEVGMAVQALWVQEDAPTLPAMLDVASVQRATQVATGADQTLRRRLGDANATALIADVAEQARQSGPMGYDQVLGYVRQRYGMAEGGVVPGIAPASTVQRPGGPSQPARPAFPSGAASIRQAVRPSAPRLPQAVARAVSGADEVLTVHWRALTPRQRADIEAAQMPAGAVAEAISRQATLNELRAGKPATVADRVVEEVHRALAPFAPLLPPHYDMGVMKRARPLGGGEVAVELQRADGSTFGVTLRLNDLSSLRAFHLVDPLTGTFAVGIIRGWAPDARSGALASEALENFRLSLGGEFTHEAVHVHARILNAIDNDGGLRARLVRHAEDLQVLDMVAEDYFRAIKREDVIGSLAGRRDLTLRDVYLDLYKNRANKEQLLEEEAIANMVELAHHGAITQEQLAPILDDLRALFGRHLPQRPPQMMAAAGGPPPRDTTGLAGMGQGMAQGMGDGLRDMLWAKVQAGDTTELGRPSAILTAAKAERDAGRLATREEFDRWSAAWAQRSGATPPPLPPRGAGGPPPIPPQGPPTGGPPGIPPVPPGSGGAPPLPPGQFSREFRFNWGAIETQDNVKAMAGQLMDTFRDEMVARGISGGGRGYVQSCQETARKAGMLNAVELMFENGRAKGHTLNAAGMEAMGTLYVSSMEQLRTLVERAASPNATPRDMVSMQHMLTVHRKVQQEFWGGVSEAGRTLNILRKAKRSSHDTMREIDEIIRSTGGFNTNQELARAIADYMRRGDFVGADKVIEKSATAGESGERYARAIRLTR